MSTNPNPESFGMRLAMAHHKVSFDQTRFIEGLVNTVRTDETGAFDKKACAAAAKVYELTGGVDKPGYWLFAKVAAHEGPWTSHLRDIAGIALQALGKGALEKRAWSPNIRDLLSNASHLASLYPKLLTAAAALGAAGGGAVYAMGNDPAREEDMEAEKLREQIEYLNSMTNEMETQLRRRGFVAE